jgi:chromosomal replication initiator protein
MKRDYFWDICLEQLRNELTEQQFNTWIKPLEYRFDENQITIFVPNRFVQQWVKEKFLKKIASLSKEHFSRIVPINFQIQTSHLKKINHVQESQQAPPKNLPSSANLQGGVDLPRGRTSSRLLPHFTFENLVTGKANQLARAAALQVAENPGAAYNPLFVYGGVGLGKTHLIQSIGNHLKSLNPSSKISYIHAERYVSDVVKAYQHKAFEDFKRHYHSLDLLLVDDIQFFSGKARTQEEFFYAFNALIEEKKQVVITCDTYPKGIDGIQERLISRFGWGLTVAIEPPELEMRVAILLQKAQLENIRLPEDIAFFIAKQIRSNVRELEGALKRVLAYSRFHHQELSLQVVKEALKDLLAVQNRQISIENIQKTVADYYKIKVADLFSAKRSRSIARPRQIAMALSKELTELSLPNIGEAFGGRDHTTVIHACKKIHELRNIDSVVSRDFNILLQVLKD